jgi:hypothetical protein
VTVLLLFCNTKKVPFVGITDWAIYSIVCLLLGKKTSRVQFSFFLYYIDK